MREERDRARRDEDDEERDRPRRRPQREEDEDEAPPPPRRSRGQSSGAWIVWLVGGIAGGVVLLPLLCCGGCVLLSRQAANGPPFVVVGNNPPPVGPQNPPPNPGLGGGNPPPPAPVWDVKADPVPRPPVKVTNADRQVALAGDFPHIINVPSTPSPFLVSGLNDFPQHKQEVWNLETMEKTGQVSGFQMTHSGVLSPDGAYLANQLNEPGVPFIVIACQDSTKAFGVDASALFPTDFYDFAGPRQLLIGSTKGGFRRAYRLYEVPGGRKLREVETATEHEEGSDALSPGGKYLAFQSGTHVLIYDLEQGRQAGRFAIPNSWNDLDHRQLAFSPDGKELAVLFESKQGARVFTWDLEGNRPGVDHTLPPTFLRVLKTRGKYAGRHLEWLEDGSGWLFKGELLISKSRAAPVWRLDLKGDAVEFPRHLVGSTHVAVVGGTPQARTLGLVEIRRDQGLALKNEPGPAKPPPPATKPAPVVRWQVRPDPLPAALALPQDLKGSLPITGYPPAPHNVEDQAVFPTSPSPFVTAATKGRLHNAHEVWDLRTMKRVGVVDPEHPYSRAVLSPDGAYFAVPSFPLGQPRGGGAFTAIAKAADVYTVADGKLTKIPIAGKDKVFENLDFAGPGQLVTFLDVFGKSDFETLVQVWDVKTRAEVRRFQARVSLDRDHRAFSAGRRYVALATRTFDRVLLYDLTSGDPAGELPLPADSKCLGLSFAPDGKSFAALLTVGDGTHLLAWDLATGKETADQKLDPAAVPNLRVYQSQVLEWLPGGGWLLYGRALVDDQSGAVYSRIPPEGSDWYPRRVFPNGRLAYVRDDGRDRALVFETLPAAKMAAALKEARAGR